MRINATLTKSILTLCTGAALAVAQTPTTGATTPQAAGAGQAAGSQSTGASAQDNHTPISKHAGHNEDHGMSSNKGAGLMVTPADQQFLVKAAQGGLMEVEAARIAQEKASSSEIKEFARKLEQDHTAANEKLKALAAQKNVDLPTDMGQHRAMLDKVKAASGDEFDKKWMKMQVQHHKKDVSEFQKESTRAMDSDVKNFATATLPTLQGHLQQAQELEGSTRGRKSNTAKMSSDSAGSSSTSGASGTDTNAKPDASKSDTTTTK